MYIFHPFVGCLVIISDMVSLFLFAGVSLGRTTWPCTWRGTSEGKNKRSGRGEEARGEKGGGGEEIGGERDGQSSYLLPSSFTPSIPHPSAAMTPAGQHIHLGGPWRSNGLTALWLEMGIRGKRGVARLLFFFKITHTHTLAIVNTQHTRLWMHHPGEPRLLSCGSGGLDTAKPTYTCLMKHYAAFLSFFVVSVLKP